MNAPITVRELPPAAPALITAAQLQKFALACDHLALAPALNAACWEFGITTPRQIRHFLGHVHVETQGLTRFEENLNYSAERLVAVFPARFATLAAAEPFARNPRALANKVYGGRFGNRPGTEDGWNYRGSGLLHHTFRANFAELSGQIGVDLAANPDLLRTSRRIAARAAAAFWRARRLNEIVAADAGEQTIADAVEAINVNEADDVRAANRVIQGGELGYEARLRQVQRAATIWRD